MSGASKRPPAPGGPGRSTGSPTPSGAAAGRNSPAAARSSTSATTTASGQQAINGLRRAGSTRGGANATPLSARAAAKRPTATSTPSSLSTASQDDAAVEEAENAKAEAASTIRDLKERLEKAELVAEETQRQSDVLQSRLDETMQEQARLEDKLHEEEERGEGLENEKRESVRQRRELESIYEAERVSAMREKDDAQGREDELHAVIQRLKETMASKDARSAIEDEDRVSKTRPASFRASSSPHLDGNHHFAPPSSLQRSNSQNNSKILLQKDKVIESLRLELAEAQIKLVEMENMGGGKVQELERVLLETRMANARLMEDNESFQLLLSEKTLNGDFARGDFMRGTSATDERPMSRSTAGATASLADELESAGENGAGEGGAATTPGAATGTRRLEAEIASLKEEKKALSLYINKIIERVLEHQGFEYVLDQNSNERPADKDLPPPPPPKDTAPNAAQSFLQRAKSVAIGGGAGSGPSNRPRPRPASVMPLRDPAPAPAPAPTVNSNPHTAPSIPLGRSQSVRAPSGSGAHRRSASEWVAPQPAAVVNSMYRPSPPGSASQTSHHPGSPMSPRSSSYFGGLGAAPPVVAAGGGPSGSSASSSRQPSGTAATTTLAPPRESSDSMGDENARRAALESLEGGGGGGGGPPSSSGGPDGVPSPPRSVAGSSIAGGASGSVMTGNKVRPLRLVRESEEDERARKQGNRGSWMMDWFNRKVGQQQQPSQADAPPS